MSDSRIVFDIDPTEQKANKKRRWFKVGNGDVQFVKGDLSDGEYLIAWMSDLHEPYVKHIAYLDAKLAKVRQETISECVERIKEVEGRLNERGFGADGQEFIKAIRALGEVEG